MEKFFYDEKLSNLILNEIPLKTKKITIISGYIGTTLIEKLVESVKNSNILKKVDIKIFIGMYGKGISLKLHEKLLDLNNKYNNLNIYYTNKLVHTKMYLFQDEKNFYLNKLIGSANFSSTLYIDKKEILTVARQNEEIIKEIEEYCKWVFKNSTDIKSFIPEKETNKKEINFLNHKIIDKYKETKIDLEDNISKEEKSTIKVPFCFTKNIPLYNLNRNFYFTKKKINNVIIPLKEKVINKIMQFNNYNQDVWNLNVFEIIWDDGISMLAKYEGMQEIKGKTYPLGIVSNNPSELEKYFKKRIENKLGVKLDKITSKILEEYGTSIIILSYISNDIFYLNFKTKDEYKQEDKKSKELEKIRKKEDKQKSKELEKIRKKEDKQKSKELEKIRKKEDKQKSKQLKRQINQSKEKSRKIIKQIKKIKKIKNK